MLKFEEKFQHPNLVHLTIMLVLAVPVVGKGLVTTVPSAFRLT